MQVYTSITRDNTNNLPLHNTKQKLRNSNAIITIIIVFDYVLMTREDKNVYINVETTVPA